MILLYVAHQTDRRGYQLQEKMIFYGNSNFKQSKKFNFPAIKRRQSKSNQRIHLKVNLNTKDNDLKNKQSCQTSDKKPLNIHHQNIRGLRGKTDELIGHLHPVFPHILCFTEHHMNWEELQQTFIDDYTLGAYFCRASYAKGGVCSYTQKSMNFENMDLEIYCIEKDFEVCALKLNLILFESV